ncbi:MAG: hypothetical protein EXR71_17930 [Myxococcales bacterium]|nr:hypothetical protein [Myxococcales bacterium]
MSALLLLSGLAFGDPPEPTFQRLFAADGATLTTAAPEPGALPSSGWVWPALLSAAGLAGAWQLRRRSTTAPADELRVVQRHALGDKSVLVLVEVQDAAGATRRLLLGSSGAGLALLNDLGEVSPAANATHRRDVAVPSEDDEADVVDAVVPVNRADEFQRMLEEVLVEREAEASAAPTEVPERPRFFSDDDLAAPAALAPSGPSRGANFPDRSDPPAAEAEPADNPGWIPVVESFTPAPAPEVVVAAFAEPIVERVGRGAAALLKEPKASPAPVRSGLSLLVKNSLPAAADVLRPPNETLAAPTLVIVPPPPRNERAAEQAAPFAAALHTRPVYVSPSMADRLGGHADRRLVGPPLRDARLTAGAPVTLRLADSRPPATDEAPVPDVAELVNRLREASQPQEERSAVNENVRPTRTDGMRAGFSAIGAKEGAR